MSEPCDHLWEAANLAAVVQEQDERIESMRAEIDRLLSRGIEDAYEENCALRELVASLTAIRERAEQYEHTLRWIVNADYDPADPVSTLATWLTARTSAEHALGAAPSPEPPRTKPSLILDEGGDHGYPKGAYKTECPTCEGGGFAAVGEHPRAALEPTACVTCDGTGEIPLPWAAPAPKEER